MYHPSNARGPWPYQSFILTPAMVSVDVEVCVIGVAAPDVVVELENPGDGTSPNGSLR